MKRRLLSVLLVLALLRLGCTTFPTTYDRVEKLRLLDFIYEPAEAAPGDTVKLTAVFAGDTIGLNDIRWDYSDRFVNNMYGTKGALDTLPLPVTPRETEFSDSTTSFTFDFVIPEDIMHKSPMIPDNWIEIIPEDLQDALPQELKSLSKHQVLTTLETLADAAEAGMDITALAEPEFLRLLPVALQLFSTQRCIMAKLKGRHRIMSLYSVRYNNRFASIPELNVPVNRNPVITSIDIYKVRGDKISLFDPDTDPFDERISLSDSGISPIVTIDKGYSYFVAAKTDSVDTAMSFESAAGSGGQPSKKYTENHLTQWYYELYGKELNKVSAYDYMNIVNMQNMVEPLYPALDARVQGATIWLQVYDQYLGERLRPEGSTLKEVYVRFEYTDAYMASVDD
ncbi:MAG: hypothetical protein GF344_19480 [Chitinivibrionales bacterium]|nr:hypothetical protein [Chitinivibrionales bacterium]MBD3358808.1 hypothetical protein [Chitinivibrionales bacterium]